MLLENDAVHPMRIFFDGGKRWYVYARNREAFLAKSQALVGAFEDCWASTEGEHDPTWRVFREFEHNYLTADSIAILEPTT